MFDCKIYISIMRLKQNNEVQVKLCQGRKWQILFTEQPLLKEVLSMKEQCYQLKILMTSLVSC